MPELWADGSDTVTSANRGRSVLGSWYELPGLDRLGESDQSPFTPKHASRPGGSDVFPRREA